MKLLDRGGSVVSGVGGFPVVVGLQGLVEHGFGQGAEVFAQAFDAAHQGGDCPGVQRWGVGGVGFGRAVADHAGDGLDGVAGAV